MVIHMKDFRYLIFVLFFVLCHVEMLNQRNRIKSFMVFV